MEAIDVAPERFGALVRALPGEGYVGANVTVPHKRWRWRSPTRATEMAREIGAANTLVFRDRRRDPRPQHGRRGL
jgi:shikimate dehydrogenase